MARLDRITIHGRLIVHAVDNLDPSKTFCGIDLTRADYRDSMALIDCAACDEAHEAREEAAMPDPDAAYERWLEDGAGNDRLRDEAAEDLRAHEAMFPNGYGR